MRRFILATVGLVALSGVARAAEPCLTADDLRNIQPSLAKAIGVADNGKGCVTPSQIATYKSLVKADRAEQAARVRQAFATAPKQP